MIADADMDPFKRSFAQFKGGIIAQFTAIIQKGSETFSSQIMPKAGFHEMTGLSSLFTTWQRHVMGQMTGVFDNIVERDLEREYADTQAEYAAACERAHCKQCGAKLEIQQFYRSEEHTSELQSLMRISYAVFCLHKKHKHKKNANHPQNKN